MNRKTMKIPFIILSYDHFHISKKLFSYERQGLHIMPVFTTLKAALNFANQMMPIMHKEFEDNRKLEPQICSDPIMALSMFETVSAFYPDLMRIVIDPASPVRDDEIIDGSDIQVIEDFVDVEDIISELRESNTPKSSPDS